MAVVRLLLEASADVNKGDARGSSLLLASGAGFVEVVRLLLGATADASISDGDRNTSLILACEKNPGRELLLMFHGSGSSQNHLDTVRLLLESGADKNAVNRHGHSPLMLAYRRADAEMMQLLLEAHADTERRFRGGNTLPMLASSCVHARAVRLLLEARADVDKANCQGNTAIILACDVNPGRDLLVMLNSGFEDCNKLEVLKLLLTVKADVDRANQSGITPLMLASAHGQPYMVQALLEANADATSCSSHVNVL